MYVNVYCKTRILLKFADFPVFIGGFTYFKGTLSVISNDPLFKKGFSRFTKVPMESYLIISF